jgi:hypothetical protein
MIRINLLIPHPKVSVNPEVTVNMEDGIQKDLAFLATRYCSDTRFSSHFILFVTMAVGRKLMNKNYRHSSNILIKYFYMRFVSEYFGYLELPLLEDMEASIKRVFSHCTTNMDV